MSNRQGAFRHSSIPLLLLLLAFAFHIASPQSGTGALSPDKSVTPADAFSPRWSPCATQLRVPA